MRVSLFGPAARIFHHFPPQNDSLTLLPFVKNHTHKIKHNPLLCVCRSGISASDQAVIARIIRRTDLSRGSGARRHGLGWRVRRSSDAVGRVPQPYMARHHRGPTCAKRPAFHSAAAPKRRNATVRKIGSVHASPLSRRRGLAPFHNRLVASLSPVSPTTHSRTKPLSCGCRNSL